VRWFLVWDGPHLSKRQCGYVPGLFS